MHTKKFPKHYKTVKFLFSPKSPYGNIKIDDKFFYIKIKAKIPVYKATQIIKQNSLIIPGINVKKEIIDFRYFYSKPLNKIPKNLVASKIISKNSIINDSNTKTAPLVFKNQIVSVIINSKNITIYSKAKALKDGNKGDIIPIEMNKKIFNAIVVDKNRVTLQR